MADSSPSPGAGGWPPGDPPPAEGAPLADAPWNELLEHTRTWCALWCVPHLADRLEIRVSSRFRTSLARCRPARREIRIARFVVDGPAELLREVLCHEVAHAAAAELHGLRVRPHGREWKTLMRQAGFEPRVRIARTELDALPVPAQRSRVVWLHRCPVCHAERRAGRPVRAWRCAACRAAGLGGRLEISRCEGAGVVRR